MNIRCSFCQTPYAISRNEILAGLQKMQAENLSHYDAHCPRCRRSTPILRQKMEIFFPNWQDALIELEATAGSTPASAPTPDLVPESQAEIKPATAVEKKPAARKRASSAGKPANTQTPETTKKTSAKKSK